jgi:hypothetical protein
MNFVLVNSKPTIAYSFETEQLAKLLSIYAASRLITEVYSEDKEHTPELAVDNDLLLAACNAS